MKLTIIGPKNKINYHIFRMLSLEADPYAKHNFRRNIRELYTNCKFQRLRKNEIATLSSPDEFWALEDGDIVFAKDDELGGMELVDIEEKKSGWCW